MNEAGEAARECLLQCQGCCDLQAEGRLTQFGKLCATPFGVDVVGITELVALTGALVGGTFILSL